MCDLRERCLGYLPRDAFLSVHACRMLLRFHDRSPLVAGAMCRRRKGSARSAEVPKGMQWSVGIASLNPRLLTGIALRCVVGWCRWRAGVGVVGPDAGASGNRRSPLRGGEASGLAGMCA